MNLLPATVVEAGAHGVTVSLAGGHRVRASVDASALHAGDAVTLGLRAEHALEAGQGSEAFAAQVNLVEHLGEANYLYLTLDNGADMVVRGDGAQEVGIGGAHPFSADPGAFHVFDAAGQALRRLQPANLVSARPARPSAQIIPMPIVAGAA